METTVQENVNTRVPDFGRHSRPHPCGVAGNIRSEVYDVDSDRSRVEDVKFE